MQLRSQIEVGKDVINKALPSQSTIQAQCYYYTLISVKATARKNEEQEAMTGLFKCHLITATLEHFPKYLEEQYHSFKC